MYKIIFIDIDGTLMNSKHKITIRTKEAISNLTAKGIYVVITSARIASSVEEISRECGASSYIIASTGAWIIDYDKNITIYSNPLNMSNCENLIKVSNLANIGFKLHAEKNLVVSDSIKAYFKEDEDVINAQSYDDYISNKNPRVMQFQFVDIDLDKLIRARGLVQDVSGVKISNQSKKLTEPNREPKKKYFIDIVKTDVSKGEAMKILARYLNITMSETMAIGDDKNDIEMFEAAGYSIAMENAIEEVKLSADRVTLSNDDDGVAVVLEELLESL
jgi:Cof subfamily protein (haloacid dehalogenase superfamily)